MDRFVRESNRIDPQPGHENEVGDPHYDDHLRALRETISASNVTIGWPTACELHAILMGRLRGIEPRDVGIWRQHDVVVGGRRGSPWKFVPKEMAEWDARVERAVRPRKIETDAEKFAARLAVWDLHTEYERIHPFADGNGRSGRLLMVAHALRMGLGPWIVPFDHRHLYYEVFRTDAITRAVAVKRLMDIIDGIEKAYIDKAK